MAKISFARTKNRSGEGNMIEKFMASVEKNFSFSDADLECMREAFSRCELVIENGCMVALQDFGDGIVYVYYLAVEKSARKKGIAQKALLKILKQRSPQALAAITCHPAIIKIFDKLKNLGYGCEIKPAVLDTVVEKIKEEEGNVGSIEKVGERLIWRGFYGKEIPQKDRDFDFSELLNSGDAFLIVVSK